MYDLLEGEHIILRKAEEKDYKTMLKNVWGDSEVYQWMLFQPTLTEEDGSYTATLVCDDDDVFGMYVRIL